MLYAILIILVLYSIQMISGGILLGEYTFPVTISLYFLINIFYLYKYKRNNIFCFELLFSISFFLCTYLTPFLLPLLDSFQSRIFVDSDIIKNKTYSLAFWGYLCYMIGLLRNVDSTSIGAQVDTRFSKSSITVSNYLCFATLVLFYANGGIGLLSIYNSDGDWTQRLNQWGIYLSFSMLIYSICIVTNFCSNQIKRDSLLNFIISLPFLFKFNTLFLVVPLILSGYRSNALQLLIPLLLMYDNAVKKINFKQMAVLVIGGFVILQIIGMTRGGGSLNTVDNDLASQFRDFIPANGANIYLVDYADTNGITYGSNMLLSILSIVPFFNISIKTDIELGQKASLKIGRGVYTRKYSLLSCLDNAILDIGDGVFINRNTIITAKKSIVIGKGVTIGPNTCIYDHDHDVSNRGQFNCDDIIIEEDVWCGANVTILKGVHIGRESIIAAGAVVTKSFPAYSVIGGIPAKCIK